MVKREKYFLLILSIIGIMIFIGCGRKNAKEKALIEKKIPVKVISVTQTDIEETLRLTGDIQGQKEADVYAKVSGKLVKKLKEVGDSVKTDEVIALIDRDEEALDFEKAQVKSPIDGVITMYFAGLGEAVFPAGSMHGDPLGIVADMDKVNIIVYIGETDIGKLRKGQSARVYVDAYKDRVFEGIVEKVAPAADPVTRKLKVEISVDNPEHILKPGTFARVEIITSYYKDVLAVPRRAVLERQGEKIVFVTENNKAKMVKVLTGSEDEKNIEIKKGLSLGNKVIIEGNYGLIEGTEIQISDVR